MERVRKFLYDGLRMLRRVPPAYRYGFLGLVVGFILLAASLVATVTVVQTTAVPGEAPPGTTARDVALNLTSFFRATLSVQSCKVAFHLLTDPEYERFSMDGRLPAATLNCNRTEALIQTRIHHLVTVSTEGPQTNVSYVITVDFFAERHPYALLSIPGAFVMMGAITWIALTRLKLGIDKLTAEHQRRYRP